MADLVPTLKVEIAFATANVYDTAPTWTDVTAYVLQNPPLQINRGRPNELGTFIPGRCTFTLNNNDGRFSPLNASSPYAGQLLPRRQVRVTATWAATDYVIFRGYVMGWPQTYAPGKVAAYVPLECYDMFAILNETDLSDPYYAYLQGAVGSVRLALRSVVNGGLLEQVNNVSYRFSALPPATTSSLADGLTGSTAIAFGGATQATGPDDTAGLAVQSYSLSLWYSSSTFPPIFDSVMASGSNTLLSMTTFGGLTFQSSLGNVSANLDSSVVLNGQAHHVVVTCDFAGANLKMYFDGRDVTTGMVFTGAGVSGMAIDTIGNQLGFVTTASFSGTIQEVTAFSKTLSPTEVANIYKIGRGVIGEDTASRFGRVCDAAGVPSAFRNLAGLTNPYGICSNGWTAGSTALPVFQDVASTEQGALFVGRTGLLTLLNRYWYQTAGGQGATIQATFSDDGSDGPYVDTGFDYDDLQVRNAVTVSGVDANATATDATSIAKYGRQELSVSTQLGTYGECLTMAQGILADLKDPKIRTRPLTLDLRGNTAQWPTVLGLDLGHRVRFEITPPGVGSQYQTSQLIQQLDYSITQFEWDVTVQGSPLPVTAGIYDTDTYDGTAVYGY